MQFVIKHCFCCGAIAVLHHLVHARANATGAHARGSRVHVTLTTADERLLFTQIPDIPLLEAVGANDADVIMTVNISNRRQLISGFGAALTDASAYVISKAPAAVREALLRKFFGPAEVGGAGFSMLRLTIGVSDFSVSYNTGNLTYDDTWEDYSLQHFSTARDDEFLIPVLRSILNINPNVRMLGTPWTAPLWLKTNPQVGEGYLKDTDLVARTYANYLAKYLEDYHSKGVEIQYLTLQNEPHWTACGTRPCMAVRADQTAKLAALLAFRLRASNMSHTKLLAYDSDWAIDTNLNLLAHLGLFLVVLSWGWYVFLICVCVYLFRQKLCRQPVLGPSADALLEELKQSQAKRIRVQHLQGALLAHPQGASYQMSSAKRICVFLVLVVCSAASAYAMHELSFDEMWALNTIGFPPGIVTGSLDSTGGHEFAGVAWHCYMGEPSAMKATLERYADRSPALEQHVTECCAASWNDTIFNLGFRDTLVFDQTKLFIKAVGQFFGSSIIYWNIALDEHGGPRCHGPKCCKNCHGLATIPSSAKDFSDIAFQPEFYGLAHHSAFVPPGAQVLDARIQGTGVQGVAYRTPSSGMVAVVMNEQLHGNVTVGIRTLGGPCTVGKSFTFSMPPGIATFSWEEDDCKDAEGLSGDEQSQP